MKLYLSMPAFTLAFVFSTLAYSTAVTPLQKVVEMLDKILATAKEGKKMEEVEFAKFKQWCDNVQKDRKRSIDEGASKIVSLSADIDKAGSDAAMLREEVSEHQASAAQMKAEADNATSIREKERADYETAHKEFSDAIDAVGRAVQVIQARSADVPQTALLQLRQHALLSSHEKSVLDAFLGLGQAPTPNAYEFQSSSVVDMLEKLASKFKAELVSLQKAEMNARHNYEVLMQRLTSNIKANEGSASEKTAAKAERLEDKAAKEGDLVSTKTVKTEDETALQDTLTECHARSEEYEGNQVTRAAEIQAIEKAIGILSGDQVKGHAETYLPSLVQRAAAGQAALAQVRSDHSSPLRSRTAAYLQAQASKLQSRYLSVVANHVSEDPFAKVKDLIRDLIVKLQEQANEEADQHAYCTTELATNKQTRENTATDVEKMTATVEELSAQATQLSSDLQTLSDEISEIRGQQAEATSIRAEEKATNEKTVSDAKDAQAAVEKAISVLRDFYGKNKDASFLQRDAYMVHAKQRGPYTGMNDDATGVLGMLDVILSDFARLETETSSAEDRAIASHSTFMSESTQNVEVKTTEVGHKEEKKRQVQERLAAAKKQLELTQEELDAALSYHDQLKKDCVDEGLSYEDRRARRKEEIASLQEALKMLDGESLY